MSYSNTSGVEERQSLQERTPGQAASEQGVADDTTPRCTSVKAKRILIIVENLPVPFDRRVWSEATALSRNGYEVSVICPKGEHASRSFEVIDGIHIYRHWLPAEGNGLIGYVMEYGVALFWQMLLSFRILVVRGFDAIHACNPPDLIFLVGALFKGTLRKRFVFDHHDINPELYEAKYGRRDFFWRVLVFLERCSFELADISIATNDSYRSIAIERGRMHADRVFVVRSGPDLDRICPLPPDQKWKMGCKYLVAYLGVIGKQEGLDLLLESVKYIRNERARDDIHFVIVGSGPELGAIREQASSAGLGDLVTFTGRVNDSTLFTILSTADVCVNPDRPNCMNDKSTMNKIMEYMAIGKPIVQFDLTEGRITAGNASLYARNADTADFGDKILELLDSPERCEQMGTFARERARCVLAWEHEEPMLLRAYKTLFEKSSKPSVPRHM